MSLQQLAAAPFDAALLPQFAQATQQALNNLSNQVQQLQTQCNTTDTLQNKMGRVLVNLDGRTAMLEQELHYDFLFVDEDVKDLVVAALQGPAQGKAFRCFKVAIDELKSAVPAIDAATRLGAYTDERLKEILLGFSSMFKTPLPEKPWRFTLRINSSATTNSRSAIYDLAAHGGSDSVQIRRPFTRQGPLIKEIETAVAPDKAAARAQRVADSAAARKGAKGAKGKGKNKGPNPGGAAKATGAAAAAAAAKAPAARAAGAAAAAAVAGAPASQVPNMPPPPLPETGTVLGERMDALHAAAGLSTEGQASSSSNTAQRISPPREGVSRSPRRD